MNNEEVILTPIPSYKGLNSYLADTINGRIWSKKNERFLTSNPNDNGYVYNSITHDDGTRCAYGVHRLVMASISGIPLEHFKRGEIEVDHYPKEEEKYNNRMDNLQMSSRKMQYRESTRSKMGRGRRLTDEEVIQILDMLEEWKSEEDNKLSDFVHMIAEMYEQSYRNAYNIVYGKTWKHLHKEVTE